MLDIEQLYKQIEDVVTIDKGFKYETLYKQYLLEIPLKQNSKRGHLGASSIGKDCAREIFFSYNWFDKLEETGRSLRLLSTGTFAEAKFQALFELIGFENVKNANGSYQHQFDDFLGLFAGSADGIYKYNGFTFLTEFKTANDKNFKDMALKGVKQGKPIHYSQIQIYLKKFELPFCLYCMLNKNTEDIYFEVVDYNQPVADGIDDKAYKILTASANRHLPNPINEERSAFACKFCDFKSICIGAKSVESVNCRTCAFSSIDDNGQWVCHNMNSKNSTKVLLKNDQLNGCDDWVSLPID